MYIARITLALVACFSLTSCGLINTALRMAPYLLMFADEDPAKAGKVEERARQIEDKGHFGPQRQLWQPATESEMASR